MVRASPSRSSPGARRVRYKPAAGRTRFPEVYFVKRIDNSHLRREVDPARRRDCFALLGLVVGVFVFALLFAWQHFECVRYGYQFEQLRVQHKALVERNHQLRLEQAALADPQRIDELARKQLGLAPPAPQQVIQFSGGQEGSPRPESREVARNFPSLVGEVSTER